MKRLIEWLSILAAIGVLGGFGAMIAMALAYKHLPRAMYGQFEAAVLTFFGSLVLLFVMWGISVWYDRVQLRRRRNVLIHQGNIDG